VTPSPEPSYSRSLFNLLLLLDFHQTKKFADALIIAHCGGVELLQATQKKILEASSERPYMRLVSSIVHKNLEDVVQNADLKDWRQVLAFISSFAGVDQFEPLCETLGRRLHRANGLDAAVLCYICAADLAKVPPPFFFSRFSSLLFFLAIIIILDGRLQIFSRFTKTCPMTSCFSSSSRRSPS